MSEKNPTVFGSFLAELKRRHVFRSLLAYGAVAFVVLQAAEIIMPAFGVGDWFLQVLVVGAILLLPVILALAWVYEITPHGIRTMKELDEAEGRRLEETGNLTPRLALLVITMVAASGAGLWWFRTAVAPASAAGTDPVGAAASPGYQSATGESAAIHSLAVLPLESFSPPRDAAGDEADDRYFAMGMHDALISRLSQLGSVRVISRTTVQQYDPTGKNVAQVGADLGVDGIVEGSVVVDGDRVRITVQLIHAPSDTHLWSADYEREMEDILALQDEVATAIAREIVGELGGGGEGQVLASSNPAPETDPEAAMAELKGRGALFEGASLDPEVAEKHFRVALEEDSLYAPAMVGLASSRLMQELMSGREPSAEVLASVRDFAARALKLDPGSREARDILALTEAASPSESGAARGAGAAKMYVFAPDRPEGLPPHVPPVLSDLGVRLQEFTVHLATDSMAGPAVVRGARSLFAVGRLDQAESMLRDLVEEQPEFDPAWEELEHALAVRGRLDQVVELRRERQEVAGSAADVPGAPSLDALAEAVEARGARGYWSWRLQELDARAGAGEPVSPVERATCYAALGRADEAFRSLSRAAEAGHPELVRLRGDPTWDRYRRDPRFGEALKAWNRGGDQAS